MEQQNEQLTSEELSTRNALLAGISKLEQDIATEEEDLVKNADLYNKHLQVTHPFLTGIKNSLKEFAQDATDFY